MATGRRPGSLISANIIQANLLPTTFAYIPLTCGGRDPAQTMLLNSNHVEDQMFSKVN